MKHFNKTNNKNIVGFQELKNCLDELYEKEFFEVFNEILILSKINFFEAITTNIKNSLIDKYNKDILNNGNYLSLIKSCKNRYEKKYDECLKEINLFLDDYKKSIKKEYKNDYITNFRKHCLQTDYYARHKCSSNKNMGFFISIPNYENSNKYNNTTKFSNKNELNQNSVKYVICMACKKIYLSKKFLTFCSYCEINYFSQIFNTHDEQNLFLAVYDNNHCEFKINEKIICSKCRSQLYIDIKSNLLKCLKCGISKSSNDLERTCNICKAKFKSNVLIYNPLEVNDMNKIINEALLAKKKAQPKYAHPCEKKLNKSIDYFHNKNCDGKIYLYNYNKQKIIICEKCKKIYNYENFIWTCPYCKEIFNQNSDDKKEKERIIEFPKNIKSMRRNYSNRFRSFDFNKANADIEVKNKNLGNKIFSERSVDIKKEIKIYDNNTSNEKLMKNSIYNDKKINYFSLSIKERARNPIRIIKSQINIFNTDIKENNNDNKALNNDKINLEQKNNTNKDNKDKISPFRRFRINNNIKTLSNQKTQNNFDDNPKLNSDITKENNIKENKIVVQKKKIDRILENQSKSNSIKNDENKQSPIISRRNNISIENKKINTLENNKKDNGKSQINSSAKNNFNSNSPRFQIKNYLMNKSEEKYKLKTDNSKNNEKNLDKNKIIKDNKEKDIKNNNDENKYRGNIEIISVSKREQNKISINYSNQSQSKIISNIEIKHPIYDSPIKANNNQVIKIDKNYNNISNSNSDSKRIKNYKFSYNKKPDNNIKTEISKFKDTSTHKISLKINKPRDIIEPDDIDINKDFPIDDPYLQSHPDIYEEIQNKLKEIMYKNKLPMFNPDYYKIEKKIGEGTHGSIYQVLNIKNMKKYAIKKIFSNDIILLKYIKKEFELVYETEHPNILGIYAIHLKCFDHKAFSFSVLMDLGETDWEIEINDHYEQNKYYTEKELISILKQLVSGLVYLQKEKEIAHRDVKPENVIIFKNNIYKLGDFGEAKGMKDGDKLSTLRGTDTYMSPILYKGLQMELEDVVHDVYKSDVFSLGYSLLYAASLNHDIINAIRELESMDDIEKELNKRMKPRYSDKFINIILKMVNPDENKRVDFISLDKIIN